ncbi:hypothetical protein TNCV_2111921 [Trichonephila clavipes]|nr:hypothetical protein TNCV_2111921 [Trichonephila clavipes]
MLGDDCKTCHSLHSSEHRKFIMSLATESTSPRLTIRQLFKSGYSLHQFLFLRSLLVLLKGAGRQSGCRVEAFLANLSACSFP